jgi:hypothetical protein
MVFFDPINEIGHLEFNKQMLNRYNSSTILQLSVKNKKWFFFHWHSIINHYNLLKKSKDGDIFLMFNNLSLFVLSFVFPNRKCSFIVHNNLDFAYNSILHKIMYKRIASKYNLIYLENRLKIIGEVLAYHKSTKVIRHPLIPLPKSNLIWKTINMKIFVSGRNLLKEQLIKICNINNENAVICNKVFDIDNFPNLEMGYLKDFNKTLSNCSKLYIIGNYKYRASGILYKALSIENIQIVFSDKEYFIEVSSHFKESKCFYEEV